jgi:phage portal protein BeeE
VSTYEEDFCKRLRTHIANVFGVPERFIFDTASASVRRFAEVLRRTLPRRPLSKKRRIQKKWMKQLGEM